MKPISSALLAICIILLPQTGKCQLDYDDHKNLLVLLQKEDFDGILAYMDYKGYELENKRFNLDLVSTYIISELKFKKYYKNWDHLGLYYPNEEITLAVTENDNQKHYIALQNLISETDFENAEKVFLENINKENWTYFKAFQEVDGLEKQQIPLLTLGKKLKTEEIPFDGGKLETVGANFNKVLFQPCDFYNSVHLKNKMNDSIDLKRDSINLLYINQNPNLGAIKNFIYQKQKILDESYANGKFFAYRNTYFSQIDVNTKQYSKVKTYNIPLIKKGTLYYITITINKVKKLYILDSGASEMSLDETTYQDLKLNAIVSEKDKLPDSYFKIADGTSMLLKRIILPRISIGDVIVDNTVCNIIQNNKPHLLGKSFLDKFKTWKIDTERNVLILELY